MMLEKWGIYGLIALLTIGTVSAVAYHQGHLAADKSCRLDKAESIARAGEQAREIALQDAEISRGYETTRVQIQNRYREIEKEVRRELPPDCNQCRLNPVALGLLNSAISGSAAAPANPSQPDQPMHPPATPGARDNPGAVGYDHRAIRKTL